MRGSDHLERGALGIRAVDVVAADDDVFEALLVPFVANVFREFDPAMCGSWVKMRCWRRSSSGVGMDFNFFSTSDSRAEEVGVKPRMVWADESGVKSRARDVTQNAMRERVMVGFGFRVERYHRGSKPLSFVSP
jgi:hypothetical protein